MCNGLCPKCLYIRELTKHHVYPRRFYGNHKNSPLLHLCRSCHDNIEKVIDPHIKLSKGAYLQLTREFLLEE